MENDDGLSEIDAQSRRSQGGFSMGGGPANRKQHNNLMNMSSGMSDHMDIKRVMPGGKNDTFVIDT